MRCYANAEKKILLGLVTVKPGKCDNKLRWITALLSTDFRYDVLEVLTSILIFCQFIKNRCRATPSIIYFVSLSGAIKPTVKSDLIFKLYHAWCQLLIFSQLQPSTAISRAACVEHKVHFS